MRRRAENSIENDPVLSTTYVDFDDFLELQKQNTELLGLILEYQKEEIERLKVEARELKEEARELSKEAKGLNKEAKELREPIVSEAPAVPLLKRIVLRLLRSSP